MTELDPDDRPIHQTFGGCIFILCAAVFIITGIVMFFA